MEDPNVVLDNYFHWNLFILKTCGLWAPKSDEPKRFLKYVKNIILWSYILVYQPNEFAVMFVAPNLEIFVRCLRDSLNHIICIYKIIRWFSYRKEIINLMETLKRIDYEEFGYFDATKIIEKHKREADIWILLFLVFVNTICLNMCIAVSYSFLFKYEDLYEEVNGRIVYAQKLPVTLLTPFEMMTRRSFILHFVFEIFPLDIYAWMIVGLDGLFTSLMSCISAHFCVLQEALRTIRPRCLKRLNLVNNENTMHDSNQLNAEMLKEMKKCILHLQMLIKSSANLEKIYNLQTCGQVMVSLFEMCFCLYLLTSSLDSDVGPELTYLVSTSFELLLYCWFGNGVTEASVAIPDAIFKGDWLSSSREFKSCMLITMIRMRRPIYMTIGKFTPLTFTIFLSIGRAAYSFFTVLKSSSF